MGVIKGLDYGSFLLTTSRCRYTVEFLVLPFDVHFLF